MPTLEALAHGCASNVNIVTGLEHFSNVQLLPRLVSGNCSSILELQEHGKQMNQGGVRSSAL